MSEYIMSLRQVWGAEPLIMVTASVIVVDEDGRILLQRRSGNDCWGLPGGSMELGESFEETARREVFEETGLVVGRLEVLRLESGRDMFYEYPNGHQVYMAGVVYKTAESTGNLRADADESLEVSWFLPDCLPANISPPDKPTIQF